MEVGSPNLFGMKHLGIFSSSKYSSSLLHFSSLLELGLEWVRPSQPCHGIAAEEFAFQSG